MAEDFNAAHKIGSDDDVAIRVGGTGNIGGRRFRFGGVAVVGQRRCRRHAGVQPRAVVRRRFGGRVRISSADEGYRGRVA